MGEIIIYREIQIAICKIYRLLIGIQQLELKKGVLIVDQLGTLNAVPTSAAYMGL